MAALCLASRDSPAETASSLYRLDLARPPGLGEERFQRAVETQDHEPIGQSLNPLATLYPSGCF